LKGRNGSISGIPVADPAARSVRRLNPRFSAR
jgi:hypothetical protein